MISNSEVHLAGSSEKKTAKPGKLKFMNTQHVTYHFSYFCHGELIFNVRFIKEAVQFGLENYTIIIVKIVTLPILVLNDANFG